MKRRTALITGASSGIGYELARLLAQDCANIVLVGRNEARLEAVRLKLTSVCPTKFLTIAADLSLPNAAERIKAELDRQGVVVDILVNAAGFGGFGPFLDRTWADDSEMIAVNVSAVTQMTKLFSRGMAERGWGRILNIASTAAFQPGPLQAVYYASKSYVLLLSEAIAAELAGSGVLVTVLCPGPTESGFADRAGVRHARLFRLIRPASAAAVAAYGYQALLDGKRVAVPGIMNRLGVLGTRIAPRRLLAALIHWLHQPA